MARRRAGGKKWSLKPTSEVLEALGHPERHFPAIHIAGTNGKGSVATLIAEALRCSGLRTGLFTSPHVMDVRERIAVDRRWISQKQFAHLASRVLDLPQSEGASFFELLTVMALAHFASAGVDVAVIETGLGGRLDSTNVLTPVLGVVTNISRDHTEYLGETLTEIALEKSGIAKPGCTLVIGETDPDLLRVMVDNAVALGAAPYTVPPSHLYSGPLRLSGNHQRRNAAVAACACRLLPKHIRPGDDAVRSGFEMAFLPGRFERFGRWVFDAAHNESAARVLGEAIEDSGLAHPRTLIFGALPDKNRRAMLQSLKPVFDRVIVTEPPGDPPDRFVQSTGPSDPVHGEGETYLPDPDRVLELVGSMGGTIVVAGSFYTVGHFRARLPGFQPPD